jgi:hypothetical protein
MRRKSCGFFYAQNPFMAGGVVGSRKARRCLTPVYQPATSSAACCLVAPGGGFKATSQESIMSTHAQGAPVALAISHIAIRQDAEGRYSLNDLHKAAGGEKRHQPSDWLRLQQTKDLIAEIENEIPGIPGIKIIKGHRHTGTYVVKELVYAYAMWISPSFHLKVIRAYDALQTQNLPKPQNHLPAYDNINTFHPDVLAAIERKAQALTLESYERTKEELLDTLKRYEYKGGSTKSLITYIEEIGWMNKDLIVVHRDTLYTLTSRLASLGTLFEYTKKAVHDLEKSTGMKWYGRGSDEE